MKARTVGLAAAVALAMIVAACAKKAEQPAEQTAPAAAATVNPATAGTITGVVKLDGASPKMAIIKMGADPNCEKAHKEPVHSQQVVTGPGGTLENVVVYIKSGLGNYSFPAPGEPAKLDQVGCMYVPHVLCMMAGQQLQVINSDPVTHNIHPLPKDNQEWNESQPPGSPAIMKVFARPEDAIQVKCNVHPWMKAYIFTFPNPYFSTSGSDGAFTIKNVPPGAYTIEAWQEQYGTMDQQVTVAASQSQTVNFTFKAQ
ncbi:MAG TPA: carboxypeptidase regulatory-like domain-containing protein [Candidatus Acidoferrales bacterium]|nr:carboxypeptidase regulatory-like domain-containing protein [Candidatus Acidoferrales bacterium]